MTNNNDQKHETFESLIEKTLTEINNMLQNTMQLHMTKGRRNSRK